MIGIVGGGLAAAKLVEGYREAGGTDEITIWSQDPRGPYHRPRLSKRVLRGEAGRGRARASASTGTPSTASTCGSARGGSLDDVDADVVVIATGARPASARDALALRTLDDSIELHRRARDARTATVVGGGFIGCEVTASLDAAGVKVTQIVREPMFFSPLQCAPALRGARRPSASTASTCVSRRRRSRDADLIGRRHRRDPERRARAATRGSRCGAASSSTSGSAPRVTGVYAIGDVAEFYDPLYGRHRRIEHWSNAAYHGTTLGQILAGARTRVTTPSRRSSRSSSGRSFRSLRRSAATTTRRSRATSTASGRCSGSSRAATRSGR